MNRRTWILAVTLVFGVAACVDRSVFGFPGDGGSDARIDASLDAGTDAGDSGPMDSGMDSGMDAGPRGPAMVNLGSPNDLASAAAYTLLSKTGITNVTGSMISNGHLGVSPIFATAITGFGLLPLDPSGQFSTSPSVVPPSRIYAADYGNPTPSNLSMAILSMQNAYTDAASRTTPDFTNIGAGNLSGLTLAPGLYVWDTSIAIPGNVTISGAANDVWIFQTAGDIDLSAGVSILLAGGADVRHIFWQVAGQVTLHATSHFEGNILCQTGITMQTNASYHGRALAQSLIALDDNAVSGP